MNNILTLSTAKSKKERRAVAKVQRKLEAKLIASGNLEALAPKVPVQKQSINLPSNEEGNVDGALRALEARDGSFFFLFYSFHFHIFFICVKFAKLLG